MKSGDLRKEDATPGRILQAATKLFAAQGYDGTSTKDICEAAEVNIAAVHYYFGSKEGLYRSIIETYGGSRLASVQRILVTPRTREELELRIAIFLEESLNVFCEQPALCRIVQSEIELVHERSEKVFRDTYVRIFETLVGFLAGAQKNGIVAKDIDPKIASQFLFNQLRQVTRNEASNKKFFGMSIFSPTFRQSWLQQTTLLFVRSVAQTVRRPKPGKQKVKRQSARSRG